MWLDAVLAYLHYTAIFILFAFLTVEVTLLRSRPEAATIRLLGRVDRFYFGSAIVTFATGLLRLVWGAKGADFYLGAWPFYVKIALFVAVGLISIAPTLAFVRWRRMLDHDPAWQVPEEERAKMRRFLMIEVHLAAMIPVFAVVMARGLGGR
jgi:putative membrane protein